jgi:hypothetical protein
MKIDITNELWNLLDFPTIDPVKLKQAAQDVVCLDDLDYRTVQLLYEVSQVILDLQDDPLFSVMMGIHRRNMELDTSVVKFPTLKNRLHPEMDTNKIRQYLRDLGTQLKEKAEIIIGGSCAVSLQGLPFKATDDLDVVDEVPLSIRRQKGLLKALASSYGLKITHFQSHYLPQGWEDRIKGLGGFGKLQVHVVDVYDIVAGKFFSKRTRDKDDLRRLTRLLAYGEILSRIQLSSSSLGDSQLYGNLKDNWYIVYGETFE